MSAEYEQARDQLAEILSRREYTGGDWLERLRQFLEKFLGVGWDGTSSFLLNGWNILVWFFKNTPAWLFPVILFLLLGFALWWTRRRFTLDKGLRARQGDTSDPEEISGNGSRLRAVGEEAARRGDFRLAIRCLFQAVLAELAERGILSDVAHRTHMEQIAEVRSRLPELSPVFEALVSRFEAVWYGQAPVGAADYHWFRDGADRLLKGGPTRAAG